MTKSISDEIKKLLSQGNTSTGIINLGYKKGTVYSVQRKWRGGTLNTPSSKSDNTQQISSIGSSNPQASSTSIEIENDPEIVRLKKEIRIAELEKQLDKIKLPTALEILMASVEINGKERLDGCQFKENGICDLWSWSNRDEIPKGLDTLVLEFKNTCRIKTSPFYCAICQVSLEIADNELNESLEIAVDELKESI